MKAPTTPPSSGDSAETGESVRPVRLQLSRRKGFDLQAWSREVNGLPAVNVARPSIFGNPFSVLPKQAPGRTFGRALLVGNESYGGYVAVPTAEDAVECFREMMTPDGDRPNAIRSRLPALRGHNLACWCAIDATCHADVLLELANAPPLPPIYPKDGI